MSSILAWANVSDVNNSLCSLNSSLLIIFLISSKVVKPNLTQLAIDKVQSLFNPNSSIAITKSLGQIKTDVFLLIDSFP